MLNTCVYKCPRWYILGATKSCPVCCYNQNARVVNGSPAFTARILFPCSSRLAAVNAVVCAGCRKAKPQSKEPVADETGGSWAKTEVQPGLDPGLEEGFQYLEGLMGKMTVDTEPSAESAKAETPFLTRSSKTRLVVRFAIVLSRMGKTPAKPSLLPFLPL